MSRSRFFVLIVGTEILNQRRADKHFDFIANALAKRGEKLSGSFVIEDDPQLIIQTIKFIASCPHSVLFSFGGIGSTPDDHTRKCAAAALRDGFISVHEEAKKIIETTLGDKAYPYPIRMAELPRGAKLLNNPINKMPGFSLDDRYFFMPGFPQMSHPMAEEILTKLLPKIQTYYRYTLTALCRENELIEVMEKMPKGVEFSSLPKLYSDGPRVCISIASYDDALAKEAFEMYIHALDKKKISYGFYDEPNFS